MMRTLRKAGGSLVMTMPKGFVDDNQLEDGSQVELSMAGREMTVKAATRPRYRLADLLAETPNGLPRLDGWLESDDVGKEVV